MRVKCLAREHNVVSRPGLEPGPPYLESRALTIRPPCLPIFEISHRLLSLILVLQPSIENCSQASYLHEKLRYTNKMAISIIAAVCTDLTVSLSVPTASVS